MAQIIDANLKDQEGSLNFGPVLENQGDKGPSVERIHKFIEDSNHLFFYGKATTVQTMGGWIEDAGEAEMKRRESFEGPA